MGGACDSGSGAGIQAGTAGTGLDERIGLDLVSASPWCILLLGLDGHIRFINKAGLALFEIEKPEAAPSALFESLWPHSERDALNNALNAARQGNPTQYSAFWPSLQGTPRWLEVAFTPVSSRDAGAEPSVMCSIRDLTLQMAAQESLKNSQQRFLALADHMAQLAWMADETGHLFWYNKRWFEFTGTTMADMEGWGWSKVHHPDHLDRVVMKWSTHLRNGEVWEDVFPLRAADGSYRWFLSRAMPFRDASGRIMLWCGTNTDITEQRVATQRLRQKARLIELSHEAIFSWDLEGAITSWNRGCEELYGYSQLEAIGKISHDLLKSQHPVAFEEMQKMLMADGSWSGEILHYAKDGSKVWVDSRHEVLRVGGKSIVLETNRDITERRMSDEIRNLLVAELNHRVKNTLAIVQSIASQTVRSSINMRDYADSFRGRLQALANAHNVLTDAHWYGADLSKLVQSELDVTFGQSGNVDMRGDPVFLSPQTALHFTLMLHELASNALKHGALSRSSGRVDVSWNRLDGDSSKLELIWRERGGPKVTQPQHKGFGTSLITRSGSLPNIKAQLSFDPQGVECQIVADLHDDKKADPILFNPVRTEMPLFMAPRVIRPKRAAMLKVLVIEPEPFLALELEDALNEAGCVPIGPATTLLSAVEAIARGGANAALVDCGTILRADCDAIVEKLKAAKLPYVLVGGAGMTADSCDGVPVLHKPVRPDSLVKALAHLVPLAAANIAS